MYHNLKFNDFEVYPHWWCCVVSDELPEYPGGLHNNKFTFQDEIFIKSNMRVYRSDRGTPVEIRDKMKKELAKGILCGYNNKKYDNIIAKCICLGFSPENVYKISEILINPEIVNTSIEHRRLASYAKFGLKECEGYQDLMDDNDKKSLKDKECSLGLDIRETTVPFGKEDLTEQDKEDIIFYCKHDVYSLHVYYVCVSKGYIDTKINLCQSFGLQTRIGYVNTNANLCGHVLEAERVHGTTIKDPTITIREPKLKAYFEKWVPKEILTHLLTSQEARRFKIYDNLVDTGDGGLHSKYEVPTKGAALYVESNDEWTMFNVDASSCYMSVMLYCDAMSRAVRNPQRAKEIYLRRIKLKQTPKSQWTQDDKNFVAAAKLVLNTTYGAMGNKWLTLYDDYMRSKVCRVGQLILIALGNRLYTSIPGLKIIQNNTDGILVYARRSDKELIESLVNEFSAISNFIFEVEEDEKLWQLNVNNYIAVHDITKPIEGDNLKNKGGTFVTTIYEPTNKLRPLGNYCIPKAQIAFYTEKKNPLKHLLDNTNVEDFCLTCTKGPTYDSMIQYNKNGVVTLGKVGRVIAVTDTNFGVIKKRKVTKKATTNIPAGTVKEDTVADCPPHPLPVNDALYNYYIKNRKLHHVDGRSWDIDYAYYARLLDNVLDIKWYSLVGESLTETKEFNL